jgi:hypothetical protein
MDLLGEDAKEDKGKLHNEVIHNFLSSPNITAIKSNEDDLDKTRSTREGDENAYKI